MKKICFLIGILFLFINFVFAQEELLYPIKNSDKEIQKEQPNDDKFNFLPYMTNLQKEIKSNWNPPRLQTSIRIIVTFKMNKDGTIENIKFLTPVDSNKAKEAALSAINSANGKCPLPKEYTGKSVDIAFTFDYNVHQKSGEQKIKNTATGNPYDNVDFAPYMNELQRRIKIFWNPPKGAESKRVVALFKIAKDGRLLAASVLKSSGDLLADKAAMQAIQEAAPFKRLPEAFKGESIDIQFTFDYNVYGSTPASTFINTAGVASNTPQSFALAYTELIPERLYATTKGSIRLDNGFKYLNVLLVNKVTSNAYLWKCKVDCKNKQIGIKKSYAGSPRDVLANPRTIFLYNLIFHDNVKMHSVDEKNDYQKIYEYVCKP